MADQYYEPVTTVYSNAIVTVRRPILTDEERARRRKAIHDAAAALLSDLYEKELRKKCQEQFKHLQ
jgi:hypothetical protein